MTANIEETEDVLLRKENYLFIQDYLSSLVRDETVYR